MIAHNSKSSHKAIHRPNKKPLAVISPSNVRIPNILRKGKTATTTKKVVVNNDQLFLDSNLGIEDLYTLSTVVAALFVTRDRRVKMPTKTFFRSVPKSVGRKSNSNHHADNVKDPERSVRELALKTDMNLNEYYWLTTKSQESSLNFEKVTYEDQGPEKEDEDMGNNADQEEDILTKEYVIIPF